MQACVGIFLGYLNRCSHYLSLEFLMGRSLQNALINLGIEDKYKEALLDLGYAMEDIYDEVGEEVQVVFMEQKD